MSQDFADLKVTTDSTHGGHHSDEESSFLYEPDAYESRRYIPDPSLIEPTIPAKAERTLGPIASGILWVEPLWIALLTPLLLLPGQFVSELLQPVLVMCLFLFWPIRLLLQGRLTPRTPIDGLLALIMIMAAVSLWMSPNRELSWVAAGYLSLGVAIYAAIVNWPIATKFPWLVGLGLCILGVGLAGVGPSILAAAPTKLFENPELQAAASAAVDSGIETVNPNILAGGLVFILPLILALALQAKLIAGTDDVLRDRVTSITLVIICGIATIGIGAVLVLTQSRGAYIAAAVSCWIVFLVRWPRLWLLWVLLLVGGVGGVSWLGLDQLLGQSKFDSSVNSFEGRTEIWLRTAQSLFDFPINGIGIGTFSETVTNLYPYSYYINRSQPHAHNVLLQVGADLGLVGLAAFVGLLVGVIMMLSRVIKTQRESPSGIHLGLAVGGIGAIVAMLVHGMFDSALWGTKLSALPWMLFGMAVILPKEQKKRRKRRSRRRSE